MYSPLNNLNVVMNLHIELAKPVLILVDEKNISLTSTPYTQRRVYGFTSTRDNRKLIEDFLISNCSINFKERL